MLVSRFAETSVRVRVVVLTRVAVGADTSDPDVLGLADTGLGDGGEELIDSLAGGDVAGLAVDVVGLILSALGADALDNVVA